MLQFKKRPREATRVTDRWWVVSEREPGTLLGEIAWWSAWRGYIFKPSAEALFDASCLREIADFCESETQARREARKMASA